MLMRWIIKKISLFCLVAAMSLSQQSSKDRPTLTTSRSEVGLHSLQRVHPHNSTSSHSHVVRQHTTQTQQQQQPKTLPPAQHPNSIPSHPGHIPRHGSGSDSTSPDSGASFSPDWVRRGEEEGGRRGRGRERPTPSLAPCTLVPTPSPIRPQVKVSPSLAAAKIRGRSKRLHGTGK